MDTLLHSNILAENYIVSFTTPTIVPSFVSSVVFGILTIGLYDKYRRIMFIPYLHYGNASLLYMISFVFIIVFTQEENVSSTETESHDRILQGSLFITPMGHFFVLLGLYHPILMCLTMTMERSKARILKYITIALMVSPLIFSIAGDIMLILEYKQDFQTDDSIHSSLILKALGSLGFLALVFLYFICVFLYFFINLNIEEKHGVKLNSLIFQLLGLGLLAALRFTYDVVICLINFFEKPSLELNIYYVLAVAGGILLILLAYLSNLSKLKIHSESPV